jgi:hypothetical protein
MVIIICSEQKMNLGCTPRVLVAILFYREAQRLYLRLWKARTYMQTYKKTWTKIGLKELLLSFDV